MRVAQTWSLPLPSWRQVVAAVTCTGVALLLVVPWPSWPLEPVPKHQSVESDRIAQTAVVAKPPTSR